METRPFKPTMTVEDVWKFTPGNPATYTGIPIVDATMEAVLTLHPSNATRVAAALHIPRQKLTHAIEVCTGFNLATIFELLRVKRLHDTILANLDRSTDEIAVAAGFCDRSAMEKLLKNKKFSQYFADINLKELRPNRYYASKAVKKPRR